MSRNKTLPDAKSAKNDEFCAPLISTNDVFASKGAKGKSEVSTDFTDWHGLGEKVLDRIAKIDRIAEVVATSSSNPVNPVNPVKKQTDGAETDLAAKDAKGELGESAFERGFVLARVGTGERLDFAPPEGATVCADWRAFGAARRSRMATSAVAHKARI